MRYSALLFGIFYGFTHQRTITSNAEASKTQAAYAHKESLIEKAKAEWVKKTLPEEKKTGSGDSMSVHVSLARDCIVDDIKQDANCCTTVISDPNDKNFDLEAYLTKLQADTP